jgi:hypothetical protein
VTEETPQDPAPGSGAGDAAPTQHIPHIPKPAKNSARKTGAGRASAAAKSASARKSAAATVVAAKSEQGGAGDPLKIDLDTPDGEVKESTENDKPLTAADYARTTKSSPASTAVIPAVKDAPAAEAPTPEASAPVEDDGSGRQASLRLNHVEPWSVTRIAFAVSVAMMIVGVVAVTIFWAVLSITGVWGQVNDSITSVLSDDSSSFDITDYLGFWRLVGLTLVLSAINVVVMTALATIAAHLYNLAAQLLGGIEVTFGEDN